MISSDLLNLVKSLKLSVRDQIAVGNNILPAGSHSPVHSKVPLDSRIQDHPAGSQTAGIDWEPLKEQALSCTKCSLSKTRTHVVFGKGNVNAELMFVGEAPGFDEDVQGEPFVGLAGQLLTKIIQAMGYSRNEVYIANVLKCRPPNNRSPQQDEIESCRPYLDAQIRKIQPKVIVALGAFAAQTLLKTDKKISGLRGFFHDLNGIQLMPTYHPAYLLRNPAEKKSVWEDMKIVMAALNKSFPAKNEQ